MEKYSFYNVFIVDDGTWDISIFAGHSIGVNAVSWCPSTVPGSLIQLSTGSSVSNTKRFASAGCDNIVKIWAYFY